MSFVHFQSATLEPCSLTREAYEQARANWLCIGCATPRVGVESVDVRLQDARPGAAVLNFVSGCGVPIARRDFLKAIVGDRPEDDFWLGRVIGPDEAVMPGWVTVRGKQPPLIVRGSKNAGVRVCDMCRRNVYFAMGGRYLCHSPSPAATAFETDLLGIVVPASSAPRSSKIWRGITVGKLPVFDHAKDGLPDDLPWRADGMR